MKLQTEFAIAAGWFRMTRLVISEFCLGVFGEVGAQVKIFEEPTSQNEKGKYKNSWK